MLAVTTFLLLVISVLMLLGFRIWRVAMSYAWPAATIGSLLAWGSVLAWQVGLPMRVETPSWLASLVFTTSPGLYADATAWVFSLSLCALAAALVLTAPAREGRLSLAAWVAALGIVALGVLAVLADSPFALVMLWAAFDLLELINAVRLAPNAALSERVVVAFAIRALGSGFAMWAIVASGSGGQVAGLAGADQAGVFYVLAAGLRLGVLPLHLAYTTEPGLRRGFGTILRLTAAATSLALLARFPISQVNPAIDLAMLLLAALATLYGGWKWLTAREVISARPYWIIGTGGLALAAVLMDNPSGATAWAAVMVLLGGVAFLFSLQIVWMSRLLALGGLMMLSLPFTITAVTWIGQSNPLGFFLWLLFLPGQVLLAAGFVVHLLRQDGQPFAELPRWSQVSFPFGMLILFITLVLLGVWGWPGVLQVGFWPAGLAVFVLAAALNITLMRIPILRERPDVPVFPPGSLLDGLQDRIAGSIWAGYRALGRLAGFTSDLFEGDGSLLWTLVLLVLFISLIRG